MKFNLEYICWKKLFILLLFFQTWSTCACTLKLFSSFIFLSRSSFFILPFCCFSKRQRRRGECVLSRGNGRWNVTRSWNFFAGVIICNFTDISLSFSLLLYHTLARLPFHTKSWGKYQERNAKELPFDDSLTRLISTHPYENGKGIAECLYI